MNKDIKINKKQLKLLAIEVVLHNIKTDYDRRNRFDNLVVKNAVESIVKDGYEVIMNPSKYIKIAEENINNGDFFEYANYLYSDLAQESVMVEKGKVNDIGLSIKRTSYIDGRGIISINELDNAFDRSTVMKKEIQKRMKEENEK